MTHDSLHHMVAARVASRLWARDTSVFSAAADAAVRDAILNRLGWLDAPLGMSEHLAVVGDVVAGIRSDGLTHVCLLGMGGSSLCAEVLRLIQATPAMRDRMQVLDTTDERAVRSVTATHDPARTLFLVASKSGSTVEVTALESYFRSWVTARVGQTAGRHFIAITDPGTSLVTHAAAHGYRHTFINPPDIGGRYSALSLFGLVSAALMDIPPAVLLEHGVRMADACRLDSPENPGLALGAFMATNARSGRDKLTLLLPDELSALGLWVEQLVAESTGKLDTGVLPIVDEPRLRADAYGMDRAFVLVAPSEDRSADTTAAALYAAGHPVFRIAASSADLGAEFFRWQFATAIAGALLDVNPFDEPNVRQAKARTTTILDGPRPLIVAPPFTIQDGVMARINRPTSGLPIETGVFVALLDYLPVDDRRAEAVRHVRERICALTGAATTHGLGPRYLHSTGQFHKGGTNAGLFILLTTDDASETPVPETAYSFSVLKQAQALGDFAALCANGRHVAHVHVTGAGPDFSELIEGAVSWALTQWPSLLEHRKPSA